MKKLIIFLVLLSSFQAKSSFFYKDLEFIAMENFSAERKNGSIYIGFDYVINNPNWYAIVIKPSALRLTVADVDCGLVKVEEKTKLKSKKKGRYPFLLIGDASKFVKSGFSSIWNLMTGKGIDFNIKGKLDAGIAIYKKPWPLDYTYKMSFEEFLSLF